MITKMLLANEAIELLTDNGMSDEEAWDALDWADENGEYKSRRYLIVCMGGNTAGTISYEITIR